MMTLQPEWRGLLEEYRLSAGQELEGILAFWKRYTIDEVHGGFFGQVDDANVVHPLAPKGGVLNARILWTFSAAYRATGDVAYLALAERAYVYFLSHFIDPIFGGVFWSVDYKGQPLDTKKQIYASAFGIYALAEYYLASGDVEARSAAVGLFRAIELHSFDAVRTGYLDAFARDWSELSDMRLSAKDANEQKTMNTHLHILEAYTTLYRAWPDAGLRGQMVLLLHNFTEHIVDGRTHHLSLFFDAAWVVKGDTVSYGHDVEASWLIQEAAEVIGDAGWVATGKALALRIADAAAEGLDVDGGLWYEYEPGDGHLVGEKHWWPQAEAMVGFLHAFQVSGVVKYLEWSLGSWAFVRAHILDVGGEWKWGVTADGSAMPGQDKVGIWKCPYHNGRACMEVMRRVGEMLEGVD